MAEERNLGVARAVSETTGGDEDTTKAELQRRMEEARESITQTVTEIKDTVTNQYQAVRQTVTDALDWREQYRRRPVAWSVGALSVGFIVGYSLGSALTGDGSEDEDYYSYEEEDDRGTGVLSSARSSYEGGRDRAASQASRSMTAAPAYTPQSLAGSGYAAASSASQASSSAASNYSAESYGGGDAEAADSDKPGILDRFKETRAYDRLQEEVSTLGDRFIDELSKVGQTVVLPMLFSKIKDMFGVDLSNKQKGTGTGASQTSGTSASSGGGPSTTSSAQGAGSSSGGGSSYGTSENRGYGSSV
jgi:ElaB/YqjD/DUF883 family membrane-anchored ribosome-binding protein